MAAVQARRLTRAQIREGIVLAILFVGIVGTFAFLLWHHNHGWTVFSNVTW